MFPPPECDDPKINFTISYGYDMTRFFSRETFSPLTENSKRSCNIVISDKVTYVYIFSDHNNLLHMTTTQL